MYLVTSKIGNKNYNQKFQIAEGRSHGNLLTFRIIYVTVRLWKPHNVLCIV